MSPTAGGAGSAGSIGGLKEPPAFGGGFCPRYGPVWSLTTLGGKAPAVSVPPPRIVDAFPDSKIAA